MNHDELDARRIGLKYVSAHLRQYMDTRDSEPWDSIEA